MTEASPSFGQQQLAHRSRGDSHQALLPDRRSQSKLTGVKAHVLRYWESEFRWMSPAKSRSQQRLYRQRDIEVILLLKRLLHEERFTIAGARKRLRELGVARALSKPRSSTSASRSTTSRATAASAKSCSRSRSCSSSRLPTGGRQGPRFRANHRPVGP